MKNCFLPATARWSFVLVLCLPAIVSSQTQEVDNRGFVLGRVYESGSHRILCEGSSERGQRIGQSAELPEWEIFQPPLRIAARQLVP